MWMLYAGEHIFERTEKLEDRVGLELEAHPCWDDEQCNGCSRDRWDLWKSRFSAIAGKDGISDETKELAQQAVVCME